MSDDERRKLARKLHGLIVDEARRMQKLHVLWEQMIDQIERLHAIRNELLGIKHEEPEAPDAQL